jgi:hypothetical protein
MNRSKGEAGRAIIALTNNIAKVIHTPRHAMAWDRQTLSL